MIPVQGIEIAIIELTGPTDCSTDYLEVTVIQSFLDKSKTKCGFIG